MTAQVESYLNEINDMRWSYSRVTAYEQCPYAWYLQYIVNDDDEYPQEENYYSQVGGFVHRILAMVFEGKLKAEEAFSYFINNFDSNVPAITYGNVMDSTYDKCAEYLSDPDNINKLISGYEIIGIEQKAEFVLDGHKFIGFIDLLLRDKEDGKLVIVDHKSGEYPLKANGKVKANAKSFEKYKRQLYLYARWVKEKYGEFPKELAWNHFKDGGKIARIPFDIDEYNEAIAWFMSEISAIKSDEEFEPKKDFFYCNNLCAFRSSCEYKDEED